MDSCSVLIEVLCVFRLREISFGLTLNEFAAGRKLSEDNPDNEQEYANANI